MGRLARAQSILLRSEPEKDENDGGTRRGWTRELTCGRPAVGQGVSLALGTTFRRSQTSSPLAFLHP
jgi:hypothetical protein